MTARRALAALAVLALVLPLGCGSGGVKTEKKKSAFFFPTRVLASAPDSPSGYYLFVLNSLGGTMSVVDLADGTNDVVYPNRNKLETSDVLDVGDYPVAMAITPAGDRVFVCNAQGTAIRVLDVGPLTTRALDDLAVGPCDMATAGASIVLADPTERRLLLLDLATEAVTAEAALPEEPAYLAATPDGASVFLTTRAGNLWKYSVPDLAPVGGPLFLGGLPTRLAVSPGGAEVLVLNRQPSLLHRVDAATLTEALDPLEVPGVPLDLTFLPGGAFAYVDDSGGLLYVYDRRLARLCGASATAPRFLDAGAISDPSIGEVRAADCVARSEDWTVTYDQTEREWIVEGEKSGKQAARATLDRSYVSDDGGVRFTIRSGSRAPSDGDEFRFSTDAGIAPLRVGQLPDGMAVVPHPDDEGFYLTWIANTLSNNLSRIGSRTHRGIGSFD